MDSKKSVIFSPKFPLGTKWNFLTSQTETGMLRRTRSQWPDTNSRMGMINCSQSFGMFQKLRRPQHS